MTEESPILFYFDFSSPYSYLASEKIDALAARFGRKVKWKPLLLGIVFKTTGAVPLTQAPLKGEYSRHDFERSARYLGVPFKLPEKFPVATQAAARALERGNSRTQCSAPSTSRAATFRIPPPC